MMSVLGWMATTSLWIIVMIWMMTKVFRDEGLAAGLFSAFCFPYAIRHAYRQRADDPWPMRLLGVAILITVVWAGLQIGDFAHSIMSVVGPMPSDKKADITGVLALIAAQLLLIPMFAIMAMFGVTWLAMIAFDREGWLHGFIAILFWPYALYYGISRYRMNRKPVIFGLAGIGGLVLFDLAQWVLPA